MWNQGGCSLRYQGRRHVINYIANNTVDGNYNFCFEEQIVEFPLRLAEFCHLIRISHNAMRLM